MAHETDVQERSKAKMEASNYNNANVIFAKELEDELMKFTTTSEDHKVDENLVEQTKETHRDEHKVDEILVEQTKETHRDDDIEVNITECTPKFAPLGNEADEAERHDTTENSSSFDNEDCDDALGDEAMSGFRGDASPALDFDGFGELFRMRKKKPTAHWRSFIQPLVWRCKWTELQIMKLQLQARKYDRELEASNKSKQIQLDKSSTVEGECARSIPSTRADNKNNVLGRKKRKRAEATNDLTEYMSRHNLFSYYENNKKGFTEAAFIDNESKNPATQKVDADDELWIDDPFFGEPGDADNSLESTLQKIECLESLVENMKGRVNSIISENAGKFAFSDDDISLSMLPSHNSSGTNYIASQLMSECNNNGDVLVPEIAITTHGDVRDVNGSTSHARSADAYEHVEDGVLIDNQIWVKEEMDTFEDVRTLPIQRPLVIKDEPANPSPPVLAEGTNQPADDLIAPQKRPVTMTASPSSKRRRGRRRGSGRWGRRSIG